MKNVEIKVDDKKTALAMLMVTEMDKAISQRKNVKEMKNKKETPRVPRPLLKPLEELPEDNAIVGWLVIGLLLAWTIVVIATLYFW